MSFFEGLKEELEAKPRTPRVNTRKKREKTEFLELKNWGLCVESIFLNQNLTLVRLCRGSLCKGVLFVSREGLFSF